MINAPAHDPIPPAITPPHRGALVDRQRNFGLDLVRATAVTAVVLAHYCEFPFAALGGYGVDLFFALSGYLIGGILYRQVADQANLDFAGLLIFWKRRWYRTLPAAYLALLVFTVMHKVFAGVPSVWWRYPFFLQNLAWPMSDFFVISWSLAIEEWFYLLFPAVVLLLRNCGVKIERAFLAGVISFIIAPILLRATFGYSGDWEHGMRQIVVYRLDALMYGVAMAICRKRDAGYGKTVPWLAVAGGSALLAAVVLHRLGPRPLELRYALLGIPAHPVFFLALVPLGFALLLPLAERCPRPVSAVRLPVQRISEWSYSIYLWHIPVYLTVREVYRVDLLGAPAKLGVKVACLVITLWISREMYNRFELYFLRKRPSEKPVASALAVG